MPLYEYVCTECGEPTEVLQKLSDPPAVECPSCHAPGLTKQISAAGFRLKGSGWYETDFKSGEKRNLVGESDSSSGSGETNAKPNMKADAKPAAGEGTAKPESPAKSGAEPAAKPAAPAKSEPKAKPAAQSTDGSKTAA